MDQTIRSQLSISLQDGAHIQTEDHLSYPTDPSNQAVLIPGANVILASDHVPILIIRAQLNLNGTDVGESQAIIIDCEPYNKCAAQDPRFPCIWTTIFDKCGPQLVAAVCGRGNTLLARAQSLFAMGNTGEPDFVTFYFKLIIYALVKFYIAKILFGKFSLKFLLRKYNGRIIGTLLECERFLRLAEFFIGSDSPYVGYDRFFRCDCLDYPPKCHDRHVRY